MRMPSVEGFFHKVARQKGLASGEPRAILVHLLVSAPRRCPVCTSILERTFHDAVFLQSHTLDDPVIHEMLGNGRLFCNNHAWLLHGIASPTDGLQLYRGLLEGVLKNLFEAESTPQRSCPICEDLKLLRALLVEATITALADKGFQHHYCQTSGFCLPHLQAVLPKVPGTFIAEMLARHFGSQLALLAEEISRQLGKFSERTHTWKDLEQVYLLTVERLVGARGI